MEEPTVDLRPTNGDNHEVAVTISARPRLTQDASTAEQRPGEYEVFSDRSPNTLVHQVAAYRSELEDEFDKFRQALEDQPQDTEPESSDWEDLEQRYRDEMKTKVDEEQAIMNDFNARFQQFMLWMQVSNEKEAERAIKRLRTRMAFVQNSEAQLTDKQVHYAKVLEAFQSAMKLLGNL